MAGKNVHDGGLRPKVQHTPGPWRLAPASDYLDSALNIDAGTRGYICAAGHRDDAEAEANARLIAAAPDMLAALDAIMANTVMQNDLAAQARAAIQKAREGA